MRLTLNVNYSKSKNRCSFILLKPDLPRISAWLTPRTRAAHTVNPAQWNAKWPESCWSIASSSKHSDSGKASAPLIPKRMRCLLLSRTNKWRHLPAWIYNVSYFINTSTAGKTRNISDDFSIVVLVGACVGLGHGFWCWKKQLVLVRVWKSFCSLPLDPVANKFSVRKRIVRKPSPADHCFAASPTRCAVNLNLLYQEKNKFVSASSFWWLSCTRDLFVGICQWGGSLCSSQAVAQASKRLCWARTVSTCFTTSTCFDQSAAFIFQNVSKVGRK